MFWKRRKELEKFVGFDYRFFEEFGYAEWDKLHEKNKYLQGQINLNIIRYRSLLEYLGVEEVVQEKKTYLRKKKSVKK